MKIRHLFLVLFCFLQLESFNSFITAATPFYQFRQSTPPPATKYPLGTSNDAHTTDTKNKDVKQAASLKKQG